jgi:Zn-dependent protease with chaperone function
MSALEGIYFFPSAARFVPATASVGPERTLHIVGADGAVLETAALRKIRVSNRIGHVVRRIGLPSGGRFEAADNDAVDDFLRDAKVRVRGAVTDWLERSWRAVAIAVLLAIAVAYGFVIFGIPASARALAEATPEDANRIIAEHALYILDGNILKGTELSPEAIEKADRLFAMVAREGARGPGGYRLLIRKGGPLVGPNAFALPDGTIIMTDEMWLLIKNDDEIVGVFGHEISHVDRRHNLQVLYQAALIPAAIAVVTGDVTQVSNIATLLPGLLMQAAYARSLEQEADDDAALMLRRMGRDPAALGALLLRMEAQICKQEKCPPNWLGSHPETEERVQRLRNFPKSPAPNSPTVPRVPEPRLPESAEPLRQLPAGDTSKDP